MTEYDDTILQEYANGLYRQANGIIFWTALRYGLAVLLVSVAIGVLLLLQSTKLSS